MAKKSKPTFQKREREKARMQRQKDKDVRRQETRARKANAAPTAGNEDPDIAGIRPGPQALPDEWSLLEPE
ncbi:MAG TPA: hypothetical protein VEZ90_04005 [Blastocatellia bacterium]|nr:hypothetical protein [Blastocatellia bacterium]